ncbi:hypothetical protein [Agaribacter marinus]|uniref:Uncharacterized protein n=1 Tax=Agaribacter marinus TaxID=1431249 RepID=A0AA37SUQ3_9ALTE|nr:hypothetical protein [Agaribacter marinus]GLR69748.1 hypothetical protein GCM10007852_06560 [Agaribacter marinus]
MKRLFTAITILIGASCAFNASAKDTLLSLKNLERQRASFIQEMLSAKSDLDTKEKSLMQRQHQLIDMERMVIRDERLSQQNDYLVHRAFSDFDMTFLVHASAEEQKQPIQHWLDSVGFSSTAIINAQPGFRK